MTSLEDRLADIGAQRLWILYHDYAGIARAKGVTKHRFPQVAADGVTFAKANWDLAITDEQVTHPIFGADSGDFSVVPDPAATWPVPYREGVAQAFGWMMEGPKPWLGDPRACLAAAVEKLARLGVSVRVALEAEFTIFVVGSSGEYQTADLGRMFTVDELDARWPLIQEWLNALDAMAIPVHQIAKEYGPGQYEFSLMPTSPVVAADQYLATKQVIRAITRSSGLIASFMPKPYSGLPGNGLHVHLSFEVAANDAFAGSGSDHAISTLGKSAIAGLLNHSAGISAIASPTPNSYKRLQPGSWAPAHSCWAFGNRAALLRVPGTGKARRIEYRAGDGTANPYLLLTALLASVHDGIETQAECPEPVEGDIGHWTDAEVSKAGVQRLPGDLGSAIGALANDSVLRSALGTVIAEHYELVKRFELGSYHTAVEEPSAALVTDWERTTYLEQV